jgi:hypothetical protein
MFSDHLELRGKTGVERLNQWGPYAVIVNKALHHQGQAGKYTVVNVKEQWVDSVHPSPLAAANQAHHLAMV